MKKTLLLVAAMSAFLGLSSCSKEDDNSGSNSTSEASKSGITLGKISVPKNNDILNSRTTTASWAKSTCNDASAAIEYEAFLSGDGGKSWSSLGKSKLNNAQMKDLESDKVYQFKVKTICTSASGSVTEEESEPNSFVAYYKKGTFGASELTENSITVEWGTLLDYDYVELSYAEYKITEYGFQLSNEKKGNVKLESGNSYKFENLTNQSGYCFYMKMVSGNTENNAKYYAAPCDGSKYIPMRNGNYVHYFNVVEICGMSVLALGYVYPDIDTYGFYLENNMPGTDRMVYYGYRNITEQEMQKIELYAGLPEEELLLESETRGKANKIGLKFKSTNSGGTDDYGFNCNSSGVCTIDENTGDCYYRNFTYDGCIARKKVDEYKLSPFLVKY